MRKLVLVGLAGAIALTVASCASDSGSNVASSPSPVILAPAQKPATSQPFGAKTPLVAQKPPAAGSVPGLIQSTNGDERARQVQSSIDARKGKDPFAGLPPKLLPPATPATRQTVPNVRQLPTNPRPTGSTPFTTPRGSTASGSSPNGSSPNRSSPLPPSSTAISRNNTGNPSSTGNPSNTPSTPTIAALPPLPSATLANGVQVSGVMIVAGVPQAIVKAPNEETSRYVRVGQRVSNGQVLVKRIEMNNGSDPVVIFEENGVEVARTVGEGTQVSQAGNPPG